jgi:PAS domain S-box-containing protein
MSAGATILFNEANSTSFRGSSLCVVFVRFPDVLCEEILRSKLINERDKPRGTMLTFSADAWFNAMKEAQVTGDRDCRTGLRVRRLTRHSCLLAVAYWFVSLAIPAFAANPSPASKNILVLYSFSERNLMSPVDLLKSALRAGAPWQLNFDVEYLESPRFGRSGYEKGLVETLRDTYSSDKPDLVIVAAFPALQFAVKHRDELFPGVPIVFFSVDSGRLASQPVWPGVTGVTQTVDVGATIELALHLHPQTDTVAIITNNSELEKYFLAAVQVELLRYQNEVKEVDLVGLPPTQILERTDALPPNTVVLFQLAPQDSRQPAIGTWDILASVGQRRPTYCIFPAICLNRGGIGGVESGSNDQFPMVAEIAKRVLSGEQPESIPIVHDSTHEAHVDWRQLRRWNISESSLPPGTVVLYREPTAWERYEKYIVAGIVLIIVQALLILGLLWQRGRKRKAEAILRESEKRFRVMANTTPSLVWMSDKDGNVIYLNDRRIEFTGRDPSAGLADTWTAFVHPDDIENVLTANRHALEKRGRFSKEYRLRRRDGVYRWMLDVAAPRINGDGEFAGFIGSASDITEQKMAQEALEGLGGRLIEAQEKERTRIARELHDDICQRLSLLSLELELANRESNDSDVPANRRIEEIRQYYSELAGDVQALSHQLHSSKLDYLGLTAALRSFCREFSQQHTMNIEFDDEKVPNPLPRDVSLCLFRVAQEALSNGVKYSGATRMTVELRGTADQIRLEVSDSGVGFDAQAAKQHAGLGMVSMQERVHLVGGSFSVESRRNWGTRIVAIVPLKSEAASFSASA